MNITQSQYNLIQAIKVNKTATMKECSRHLKWSDSYTRTQLAVLEAAGIIEKTDNRQPFIYQLADETKNAQLIDAEKVARAKIELMAVQYSGGNVFIETLRTGTRMQWAEAIPTLRVIAQAIEELMAAGELIDTL